MKVIVQGFSANPLVPQNRVFEASFSRESIQGMEGWRLLESLTEVGNPTPDEVRTLPYIHGGFVDSHLHLSWMGEQLCSLSAERFISREDFFQMAKRNIEEGTEGETHCFFNWQESLWNMDSVALTPWADRILPAEAQWVLFRICGHKALVSPAVYRTVFGQATDTSIFVDSEKVFQLYTWLEKERAPKVPEFLTRAQEEILKVGINASSDMAWDRWKVAGLRELLQRGHLAVDVAGVLHAGAAPELETSGPFYTTGSEVSPFLGRAPVLTCRHWKKFLDGSFGARTAWLSQPYSDDPENFGRDLCEIRELLGEIDEALNHGFHLSFHAIGDAAIDRILDIEEMLQSMLTTRRRLPNLERMPPVWHRIEHAQLLRDEQVARLSESRNWVLCTQPFHREMDVPFIEQRLGAERHAHWAYRHKSLTDAGIPTRLGSDAPIGAESPERVLEALVRNPQQKERPLWNHALWLYTRGSRKFLGLPDRFVTVGQWVWQSQNPDIP